MELYQTHVGGIAYQLIIYCSLLNSDDSNKKGDVVNNLPFGMTLRIFCISFLDIDFRVKLLNLSPFLVLDLDLSLDLLNRVILSLEGSKMQV